jgi:formylglycine-generating enzyme required for sulfatase activity
LTLLRTAFIGAALAVSTAIFAALYPSQLETDDMVRFQVLGRTMSVARNEVTVAEWQACVDDEACEAVSSIRTNAAKVPVTGVNWFDVQAYITWLNARQGRTFRLPTAEEWQAISGKKVEPKRKPLFDDPRMAWAAVYGGEETPRGPVRVQGSWSTSKNGLTDLEGNVWEWTMSCGDANGDPNRCPAMHVMGAHDAVISVFIRNPASGGCSSGTPPTHVGFRLVEELPSLTQK